MERDYGKIYFNARRTAGLTQERWAEVLGLSVDAIYQYEAGKILPSDEVVLRMAEACGQHIVCYWHLKYKSGVANDLLPEVDVVPLPQAVVQLLVEVKNFRTDLDELLIIAADGLVDETESDRFLEILDRLQALIRAAIMVNYAERGAE